MSDVRPPVSDLDFRFASVTDCELLASWNAQLIRDEGHRNSMTLPQLAERMAGWLVDGAYRAVLFHAAGEPCGYVLFRHETDHVYVRQLFVSPQFRRRGIGSRAIAWLWQNAWPDTRRLRIDVLIGNAAGRAFWQAVGFQDYCLTMEAERAARPAD